MRDRRENVTKTRLRVDFYDPLIEEIIARLLREKKLTAGFADRAYSSRWFRSTFNGVLIPQLHRTLWTGARWENDWIESAEPSRKSEQALDEIERQLTKGAEKPPKGFDVEVPDEQLRSVRKYLTSAERELWTFANKRTKRKIRKVLVEGIRDGDTLKQAANRLQRELRTLKRHEALRIARTENTGSMNFGQHQMRLAAGIEEKQWISTRDRDTRGNDPSDLFDHVRPNGQVQPNEKLFELTGPNGTEYLAHPGDRTNGASAGNIIHCRCAAVAHIN